VLASCLAGIATLAFVQRRRYEPARYGAALAVAAIVAGWGLARWPTILPGLTVDNAAAGHDTLVSLVVAVVAGGLILFPALVLLFRLTLVGRFRAAEVSGPAVAAAPPDRTHTRAIGRAAVACLIVGTGLLTVADTGWAHGVGVTCLLAFVVLAFDAILLPALDVGDRT
jgi:cytochrome d ubiquinol oxidase subunit II